MVKKITSQVDSGTPNKDRLVLVCLFAILAFTVVNTTLQFTQIAMDNAAVSIMY